MRSIFCASVLKKHVAEYEVCEHCGFLRASEPNWLEEAYSSPVAAADTGLVERNMLLAKKVASVLYWVMGERGKGLYLDAAGGHGIFTRLMRDMGFNFYWEDKYCANTIAPGFDYKKELGFCNAVTAIEVFEHLRDPAAFVQETFANTGAEALIFTTELYEGSPPRPGEWWYYAFETGQHIGFFQRRTLEILAARVGLKFASANGLHVLSKKSISQSVLKLSTGRWSLLFSPWWIKRRLGSKVLSDHLLMMSKSVP
jgi:hypothetical protein